MRLILIVDPTSRASVVSHKYLYNTTRGLYAAGHYVGYQ